MERKTGDSAQIWQLKFGVIQRILESESVDILDEKLISRLKQYRERGVYFIEDEEQSVEWGAL